MRFLLALMLTECHKPSFKSLPAKETGRVSVGMNDLGRCGESRARFLACGGPRTFSEWPLSSFGVKQILSCFPGIFLFLFTTSFYYFPFLKGAEPLLTCLV